jgi:NAD(P)-dependent dehydrogenase (short-subunit alcohol dehydrogenase family)
MIDGQSPVSEAVGRDKSRVTGKHILITGGTNGIGLAAAEALAALGANICVVGRNETRTKIAAARVRAAPAKGVTVGALIADLTANGMNERR